MRQARALYQFSAQQPEELSFNAGDILTIINQEANEGWLQARNSSGGGGFIPANYVEFLSMPEPSMPPPPPPSDIYVDPDDYGGVGRGGGGDARGQLGRQDTHDLGDWDEDDWDDDDDLASRRVVDGQRPSAATLSVARPVSTMSESGGGSARYNSVRKGFGRTFARTGGEEFLLGIKDSEYMKISDADRVSVAINDATGLLEWQWRGQPYECSVGNPKKQSKMKGMKSYIAYTVEPSFSGIRVSRRYKHFDWLHKRLAEKFISSCVPPLPDKQIAGRYEDEFIGRRMRQLQLWVNRMISHPVISSCDVFMHFLTCTDEKMWKGGKRKAERDELQGAKFFFCISTPNLSLDWDAVFAKGERYENFVSEFDKSNKHLCLTLYDNSKKQENHFKKEFQKVGDSFIGLTKAFELDPDNRFGSLTSAIHRTGQTYNEIGLMFQTQPKKDAEPLLDSLNEYTGILSCMPGIIQVQKGAATTVRESRRGFEEDKIDRADLDCISERAQTISHTMTAEINFFQARRAADYKLMMETYLREQIAFYREITQKLEDALSQFEKC